MSKQRTENMTVSELRIGNFIRWGVHDCKVKSFTRADINKDIFIYTDKTIGAIDISDFNPIELTHEWLERGGAKRQKNNPNYYTIKTIEDSVLVINWNEKAKEIHSIGIIHPMINDQLTNFVWHIKTVHHFQNLIHSLTGTELDFNIPNET